MDNETENALQPFRREIDALDERIIEALAARFKVCATIALVKKKMGIAMMQQTRVDRVKERCADLGTELGVDRDLVASIYCLIIKHSCTLEDTIIGSDEN